MNNRLIVMYERLAANVEMTIWSIEPLVSEPYRSRLHSLPDNVLRSLRMQLGSFRSLPSPPPPATMTRVPKTNFIGPIADGPSSPWFRQALGADYAWWREQASKVRKFDLIVYEACNFADGRRTLAEIEEAVRMEYGEVPEGLVEGIFERLAKIGLLEFTEEKKQPQMNTDKHR